MKEIRQANDKAVSPIIATILLIAITVVLAATLVTILGGFTHSASNTFGDAAATVSETGSSSSGYTLNLSITSFSGSSVSNSQVTIAVSLSNGSTYSATLNDHTINLTSTGKAGAHGYLEISITSSSSSFTAGTVYTLKVVDKGGYTGMYSISSVELTHNTSTIYTSGAITVT